MCLFLASAALSSEERGKLKIGLLLGFSGPIETLTAPMGTAVELATREAPESGVFLGGGKLVPILADTTCMDAAVAVASAQLLIADGVVGLVGGSCFGATAAILKRCCDTQRNGDDISRRKFARLERDGRQRAFFRTVSSNVREGQVMAAVQDPLPDPRTLWWRDAPGTVGRVAGVAN